MSHQSYIFYNTILSFLSEVISLGCHRCLKSPTSDLQIVIKRASNWVIMQSYDVNLYLTWHSSIFDRRYRMSAQVSRWLPRAYHGFSEYYHQAPRDDIGSYDTQACHMTGTAFASSTSRLITENPSTSVRTSTSNQSMYQAHTLNMRTDTHTSLESVEMH